MTLVDRWGKRALLSMAALVTMGVASPMITRSHEAVTGWLVGPPIRISAAESGTYWWAHMDISPTRAGTIIVCGTRTIPGRNAAEGYVYLTTDYGRTWRQVLTDSSTAWVSEESCAFGPDDKVYFVASSSAVFHGLAHHDLGRSQLYNSSDAGLTWHVMTTWPFIDYTSTAVDLGHGARSGQVYVFANNVETNDPASGPGVLTLPPGNTAFTSPVLVAKDGEPGPLFSATPMGSVVLDDGAALAVFLTDRSSAPGPEPWREKNATRQRVEVVRSKDGGRTLGATIGVSDLQPFSQIGEPALAVDRSPGQHHGRIYVSWAQNSAKHVQVVLATSDDDGITWRRRQVETLPDLATSLGGGSYPGMTPPTVAVNRDGVVGLFWVEHQGRCPRFAGSRNGGDAFDSSVPVTPCDLATSSDISWYEHYLFTWPESEANRQGARRDESRVGIRIQMNVESLVPTSMVADNQGSFHPIWLAMRQGGSQLWTTTIAVSGQQREKEVLDEKLTDITGSVALEFTNNQFDPRTGTFSVDVMLVNRSTIALPGPFLLQPMRIRSSLGRVVHGNVAPAESATCRLTPDSYLANESILPPQGRGTPVRISVALRDIPRTDSGEIEILLRVCGPRG
jgi:hypothetical protein